MKSRTFTALHTQKIRTLRGIKRWSFADLYDAHPVAAWLLLAALAAPVGVMASWIVGTW